MEKTITYQMVRQGSVRYVTRPRTGREKLADERWATVSRFVDEGICDTIIADILGLTYATVVGLRKARKVPAVVPRGRPIKAVHNDMVRRARKLAAELNMPV